MSDGCGRTRRFVISPFAGDRRDTPNRPCDQAPPPVAAGISLPCPLAGARYQEVGSFAFRVLPVQGEDAWIF